MTIPGDHGYRDPTVRRPHQRVLNESWPLRDKTGSQHARGIEDRDTPIDVVVRLELEDDGEVFVEGTATRWHGQFVFVVSGDERVRRPGVWVRAGDVRRRGPS